MSVSGNAMQQFSKHVVFTMMLRDWIVQRRYQLPSERTEGFSS